MSDDLRQPDEREFPDSSTVTWPAAPQHPLVGTRKPTEEEIAYGLRLAQDQGRARERSIHKLADALLQIMICRHGCRWTTSSKCSLDKSGTCSCACHETWMMLDRACHQENLAAQPGESALHRDICEQCNRSMVGENAVCLRCWNRVAQNQGGERELVEELLHRVSPSVRKVWGDMYGVDLSNERLVALRPTREEPRDETPKCTCSFRRIGLENVEWQRSRECPKHGIVVSEARAREEEKP